MPASSSSPACPSNALTSASRQREALTTPAPLTRRELVAAAAAACGALGAVAAWPTGLAWGEALAEDVAERDDAGEAAAPGDGAPGQSDADDQPGGPLTSEPKPATEATAEANAAVYRLLDFSDESERELAMRGLLAAPGSLAVPADSGGTAWDQDAYGFLREGGEAGTAGAEAASAAGTAGAGLAEPLPEAPGTANPALWRNSQLNAIFGLFEVVDGIYQVRGYDLANMTFIRGERGWVVLDCLGSVETARAAMELLASQFGDVPVTAVVISHSHIDHFGGIDGVVGADELADPSLPLEEQAASGKVPLLAPAGFRKAACEENVLAGSAMRRRADYQYGTMLEKGERGGLSVGIGLTTSDGTSSFLEPTFEVSASPFECVLDGVRVVLQLTPGTEAPAEMNAYLPDFRALWMAENCSATMHNLYTLRGAEVRDAAAWASFIMEARSWFVAGGGHGGAGGAGSEQGAGSWPAAEVVMQSHNWPRWGTEAVDKYLLDTAAVYAFIQAETLRCMNCGMTPAEIASSIRLPEGLERVWYTRQHYGTLVHNAKAVYQRYMGWYDANPVHLAELEPCEYARKLVSYLGDPGRVIELARQDFERGEYQWVAQIANTLVFADPQNLDARCLCADALEQLGYQAESGSWRNAYLAGAYELRHGTEGYPTGSEVGGGATARSMDTEAMLGYLAMRMDPAGMEGAELEVNLEVTDDNERYLLRVHQGVILWSRGDASADASAELHCKRLGILGMATGNQQLIDACVEQEPGGRVDFLALLDQCRVSFPEHFNIVEP